MPEAWGHRLRQNSYCKPESVTLDPFISGITPEKFRQRQLPAIGSLCLLQPDRPHFANAV
jgi:hypothetical protein